MSGRRPLWGLLLCIAVCEVVYEGGEGHDDGGAVLLDACPQLNPVVSCLEVFLRLTILSLDPPRVLS